MIKIICVGKLKENYLVRANDEYLKRLSKYTKLEIIEIKDEAKGSIKEILEKEAVKIKKYIKDRDYNICLAIEGGMLSSEQFSAKIENLFNN